MDQDSNATPEPVVATPAESSPRPQTPPVSQAPPQVIIQSGSNPLALRLFAMMGWAGFVLCGFWAMSQMVAFSDYFNTTGGITEKFHSGAKFASNKVAIININGMIVSGEGYVKKQAGIRNNTLIVNLPGKPKAIRECLDAVFPAIPYCVDLIGGPFLETNEEVIKAFRPKSS